MTDLPPELPDAAEFKRFLRTDSVAAAFLAEHAAGPGKGIHGAKMTGGGSGGTVAFLTCGERAEQTVHEIAEAYRQKTGRTPQIFLGGQSPGAAAFGSEQI